MIIQGNALHLPLKDGTVQCCVTSPPYYGLRDYGTAKWQGGDPNCDHIQGLDNPRSSRPLGKFHGGDDKYITTPYKDICGKCGAIRIDDQIGLEPTPDEYIAKLVQVFREVKRVLKDDGTLWVNIGDSYTAGGSNRNGVDSKNWVDYFGGEDSKRAHKNTKKIAEIDKGCKPKDLIGIPWMVAFALRADGWYLRSDIIWAKPNPMPESVKDRPTKAHEYVFLLAKSQRYYYDADSIKTPTQGPEHDKHARVSRKRFPTELVNGIRGEGYYPMANARDVWWITTVPFKGAHFAVMPEKLVEPCVLAGTSEYGQCPKCGANWVRVTDHKVSESKTTNRINNDRNDAGRTEFINAKTETLGWQPTCDCNAGREPNIVLDPFAGSGTVGVVAQKHGRQFIGIELNPDYVKLAEARLLATPQSLFNQSVLQETP